MPTKIRLQRYGGKKYAFYHVVIADSRSPRDGKFIEKIGTYNPNTDPATIDIKFDSALKWIKNGAQPTDSVRALLSYKGILLKHHLEGGVKKGALTKEQAENKFNKWLEEKDRKIQTKTDKLAKNKAEEEKIKLDGEKKFNQKRLQVILEKKKKNMEGDVKESNTTAESKKNDDESKTPPVENKKE